MFIIPSAILGAKKEWKVELVKVKALVNFATQQHEVVSNNAINCQATKIGLEIYGDSTFSTKLIHSFCQWLASRAFVYSLATIERAHKMFYIV